MSFKHLQQRALAHGYLGDSDQVAVGDEVYVVGNPRGLEGTFSAGIISSIREVGENKLLQITAPISPGSSGGPVLNSKGEVVGVAVATFQDGQNLNFAIPSRYLAVLKISDAVPFTGAKDHERRESVVDRFGGRAADAISGGSFLWDGFHDGRFTFSLQNKLLEPVKNVRGMLIFYDDNGNPIDTCIIKMFGLADVIPAGLAKRIEGHVDASVKRLTGHGDAPKTKLEFRLLDFEIATNDE